jgi:hypothetical protein
MRDKKSTEFKILKNFILSPNAIVSSKFMIIILLLVNGMENTQTIICSILSITKCRFLNKTCTSEKPAG